MRISLSHRMCVGTGVSLAEIVGMGNALIFWLWIGGGRLVCAHE